MLLLQAVAAGLVVLAGAVLEAAPARGPRRIQADGRPIAFEVATPGADSAFEIVAVSGCRYRLQVRGTTLRRPVLTLAREGEEPLARVTAEATTSAEHVWQAIRDERLVVRVGGLSAMTGQGTLSFATLGVGDLPTRPHRRVLLPGEERARVGELLLGEENTWDLAVAPGVAYQVTPTEGTAGRVRLLLRGEDGSVLADSEVGALSERPLPPLRFVAPAPLPDVGAERADAPLRLAVRGTFDGGGSYGLTLRPLVEGETVEPPPIGRPEPEPSAILDDGPTPVVRAERGDLVLVHVAEARGNPYFVQMLRGTRWQPAEGFGQQQRARTHYESGMTWFRPYHAGTYRFVGLLGPAPSADVMLLDRAELGGAPIHMGTSADPEVKVQLDKTWRLTALGACMPGWDYLFVLRGAPSSGVGMRVIGPDGRPVAQRAAFGAGTWSPGLGPTLRFRAKEPGIYRLEGRDPKGRVVAALLRHAEDRR